MSQHHQHVRWHCRNRDCEWSMVSTSTDSMDSSPRCFCGQLMEQAEVIPVFTYLDFLRGESDSEAEEQAVSRESGDATPANSSRS
jgi:hypothetical protein